MKVKCPAPGCGKTLSLKKDGTVWNHSGAGGGVCKGAGALPVLAVASVEEEETGTQADQSAMDLLDTLAGKEEEPGGARQFPRVHPDHGRQNGEQAPWFRAAYGGECGECDGRIEPGELIKSDGAGGYVCCVDPDDELSGPGNCAHPYGFTWADDGIGNEGSFCRKCGLEEPDDPLPALPVVTVAATPLTNDVAPDMFAGLFPPEPEEKISGQPEPKRDGYGRYLMKVDGKYKTDYRGKPEGYTRATTFAKTLSDTFALSQWGKRSVAVGLAMRPDLLAQVHGKDVRADKRELDTLHEKASEAAGDKIYAALGTALHTFTEKLDAGLMTLDEVPPQFKAHLAAYVETMAASGFTTRPEWIERTTMVGVATFGEAVAGTTDRLYRMPDGTLVIGDLKTGRDLSYGWGEIAIQLLTYALGANEYGFYDWNTDKWERLPDKVRTDYAIVMHMPVQIEEGTAPYCKLYKVKFNPDILSAARMCAAARRWRKTKDIAEPYVPVVEIRIPAPVVPDARQGPMEDRVPAPPAPDMNAGPRVRLLLDRARTVADKAEARDLYGEAMKEGVNTAVMKRLATLCAERLTELEAAAVEPTPDPVSAQSVAVQTGIFMDAAHGVATKKDARNLYDEAKAAGVLSQDLKRLAVACAERLHELGVRAVATPVAEAPREPTWDERFAVATSRGAMATLYAEAKAGGVNEEHLRMLVNQGMKRLEELEDPAG